MNPAVEQEQKEDLEYFDDYRNPFSTKHYNACKNERGKSSHYNYGNSLKIRYWGREKLTRRVWDRKFSIDTAQHAITDHIPANKMQSKNPFPVAVSYLHAPMNRQESKRFKTRYVEPKMTLLTEIYENLYLGNFESTNNVEQLQSLGIRTVINLAHEKKVPGTIRYSDTKLKTWHGQAHGREGVICFSPSFQELRAITFSEFVVKCNEVAQLIVNSAERGCVLLVCENGVNKSAAMAIAFAISKLDWTYENAVNYVDSCKLRDYDQWDNLTNVRIVNLLRALQTRQ